MAHHELDQIYFCPRCEVETLHFMVNNNQDLVGIVCSYCHTPSLVRKEILSYHQLKWEEELRQILSNLENPFDEN